MKKDRVSVIFPTSMHQEIKRIAKERGITMSAYVEEALVEKFVRIGEMTAEEAKAYSVDALE